MLQQALSRILFPNRCFFEGNTVGVQGDPARHLVLAALGGLAVPLDRPMRVLEIGSWTGFSALTLAQAAATFAPYKGTVLCVDPWAPYFGEDDLRSGDPAYETMDSMARSGLAYELFRHNVRFAPEGVRVDHLRAGASDAFPYLEKASFDLVHVDGSRYFSDVLYDLSMAHELLRDGGIVCGGGLDLQAGQCDLAVAEESTGRDRVRDPATGRDYHPGVTLAVHEFFGPVPVTRGGWYMRRTASGYRPVDVEGAPMFLPAHFPEAVRRPFEALTGR